MHHDFRRFLNVRHAKKHLNLLTLFFFTQLTACAPSSGGSGGTYAGEGLLCAENQNIYETQNDTQETESISSLPKITVDPHFDSYIVEFESSEGLQPSGNPIHEYEVSGISLKNVHSNTYSFQLSGSEIEKKELIAKLGHKRTIKFVEPDYPLTLIPTEEEQEMEIASSSSAQWQHQNIQSTYAWQTTRGSEDIVVAVVDSGIDHTHIDLKDNMWSNSGEVLNGRDDDGNGYVDDIRGWNFVSNNNNPTTTSSSNHGTHVAGIIGATGKGSRGIFGEAQKVKLMALRFIGESGSGATSSAIKAIDYAVRKKVFAINNSWGSTSRSQALDAAIRRAEKAGILFIVAAGNGQSGVGFNISNKGYYPAAFTHSNIIRVAASKSDNTLTKFSNFSQKLVDVAAPGQGILSTVTGNRYMKMSGTSMAAPLVSGLAVLVKAANPSLNYSQIKAIISTSVDPITLLRNKVSSGGRVNARKAVAMAANISAEMGGCP